MAEPDCLAVLVVELMSTRDRTLSQLLPLDRYEVKARLLPSILSCLAAMPGIAGLIGSYPNHLDDLLRSGSLTGLALIAGLGYTAAAAGRRYERKIWSGWPYDAPTNLWLHPDDSHCSKQQKEVFYEAINRIVGLDITIAVEEEDRDELKKVINDAVSGLRHEFRVRDVRGLLKVHDEDYGFARNLAGLYVFWLPTSVLSATAAWGLFFQSGTGLVWGLLATIVLILAIVLLCYGRTFVIQRADRYAESFFGTLLRLDRELHVRDSSQE